MVTQLVRNKYPTLPSPQRNTVERRGNSLLQRQSECFLAMNSSTLLQTSCFFLQGPRECWFWLLMWEGREVQKKGRGGRVQTSLQKQPASAVEERWVFNNASRSAITLGKSSSTVLFSSSCPWYSWGDLPAITTSFPEFLWLSGVRMRNGAGPSLPGLRGEVVHLC